MIVLIYLLVLQSSCVNVISEDQSVVLRDQGKGFNNQATESAGEEL